MVHNLWTNRMKEIMDISKTSSKTEKLSVSKEQPIRLTILIVLPDQKTVTIQVDPNSTVAWLRKQLEVKTSYPSEYVRLIYQSKNIKEKESLSNQGLTHGSIIYASLRLPGGMNSFRGNIQESNETFYDILGISNTANIQQIKESFKKGAKKFHPDKNPENPRAEEIFKKLAEAYETLSHPVRRNFYDKAIFNGSAAQWETDYSLDQAS